MQCPVLAVDAQRPAAEAIARAAEILRSGGLVAFPTETVYGLGANALDANAVAKIFVAKGRPATNPIIVHVATIDDANNLVSVWPSIAQRLAERFWPGPLTLVLPRAACVPDAVTAGGPTLGIRMPAHPVAHALLQACRLPIAAPSANRSTELSPTLPGHVLAGLGDRIELLLDSGPTAGGIESTVLDLTTNPPRLLRPGLATIGEIEAEIGPIDRGPSDARIARSPGQMRRHYAPNTPIEVVTKSKARVAELTEQGLRVGWMTHMDGERLAAVKITLPSDAIGYAAQMYAALHQLDDASLDRIIVEMPPEGDDWLAIHDRLHRACVGA
ncbi:MAG: threonylcarbamoyl-AMP synthase [Planctomycetes bacterium]|nr:threonylcarbamoyl-AMP synthase [Planctomycetota bacterium]